MEQILQGISLGLVLSILAGPIFLSLITLGIERGLRAGTIFAAGQWASDLMFIGLTYLGMAAVAKWPHFKLVSGLSGGLLLIVFGTYTLLSKPRQAPREKRPIAYRTVAGLFLRGFLINTLNPFPLFFWLSVASEGFESGRTPVQFSVLYASLLGTIALTDVLKVYSAKKIRRFLTADHLLQMRRIAGMGLIAFGLILIWRVWS
jgi:threonine/homoserine/homoserine lactone efflux protein